MISQKWKQLGFDEPCPVPVLEAKVILAHDKDYRLFEAAQKLRRQVADYLNALPEGWVPIDAWDRTQSQHREVYDRALQGISGAGTAADDAGILFVLVDDDAAVSTDNAGAVVVSVTVVDPKVDDNSVVFAPFAEDVNGDAADDDVPKSS